MQNVAERFKIKQVKTIEFHRINQTDHSRDQITRLTNF